MLEGLLEQLPKPITVARPLSPPTGCTAPRILSYCGGTMDVESGEVSRRGVSRGTEREETTVNERSRLTERSMPESGMFSSPVTRSTLQSVQTVQFVADRTSAALVDDEASVAVRPGCWETLVFRTREFLTDMFGSEFDFATAYARAKGTADSTLQSAITSRTDNQQEAVRASEHLKFFPLTFKDTVFENEYALICSELFIGRFFLVLVALIILVIPVLWVLSARCWMDVQLPEHSQSAWVAFHVAMAVSAAAALTSLNLTVFPKIIPPLRRHFEHFTYANVFLVSPADGSYPVNRFILRNSLLMPSCDVSIKVLLSVWCTLLKSGLFRSSQFLSLKITFPHVSS